MFIANTLYFETYVCIFMYMFQYIIFKTMLKWHDILMYLLVEQAYNFYK